MQEKLLSIVIPTFNIEQYIVKNIESFKQVKENYYSLFELIIVNDGSTDSTLEVTIKFRKSVASTCNYKRKWGAWINYQCWNSGSSR